ncbi:hypothetical protein [Streptomyces sp. NPDC029003]|uniref:hypothetical protein n=1 Tax=Streptomyces sp. NPDC029003 TaxID=3155125 RepID=UPI0033D90435
MPHALHLLGIAAFAASGVLAAHRADMAARLALHSAEAGAPREVTSSATPR